MDTKTFFNSISPFSPRSLFASFASSLPSSSSPINHQPSTINHSPLSPILNPEPRTLLTHRSPQGEGGNPLILLVGNPNVGKSALFNKLTGKYVTVSNYPGTTVEVSRGFCQHSGTRLEIIDTPGMYSLVPITDEERVASDMLFSGDIRCVVHVLDAKNLERMLGLTLQLIETGLPVVLAVNMIDEARDLGITIDTKALSRSLGIPVVATSSLTGEGATEVIRRIATPPPPSMELTRYGSIIESAMLDIAKRLSPASPIAPRARAGLILQGDTRERERLVCEKDDQTAADILNIVAATHARLKHSPHYYVTLALRANATRIAGDCVATPSRAPNRIRLFLDRLCTRPLTGYPLVALVLYFVLFKFVGQFGAGTLVDLLEDNVFHSHFVPWVQHQTATYVPWGPLRDLLAGDYGILTLGLRYAIAIIFPIVGTFFLAFAILEDSGYLPRLALLVDRGFKRIGLNGRAVIPLVLGFGCDTMATLVTRTLETRRERIICTILLALAIPCSAQLGVILGLLSASPAALAAWAVVVLGIMLVAGWLAAKLLPGERPMFYMELPPLRLPSLGNVVIKTYTRMVWYFKEILPTFIIASVLIWLGQITGIFDVLIRALTPVVRALGLPAESAVAFLFGFFRRDYGAAGLYDLQKAGGLTMHQLTVAAITLTLFLPCVAQFLVMQKERGTKTTLWISAAVLITAFGVGYLSHIVLGMAGI
jgi:ferrous iron transport protein B